MKIEKSGMIAIIGRPNVGKSTLINMLSGEKVAIVSDKPQTTRGRICAVLNRDDTQYIFMDTPGFHKPRSRLGEYMVDVVRQSVTDVDAVVLVVEPVASVGRQEKLLIERIEKNGMPAILVINKIDTVKKDMLLEVIGAYCAVFKFAAVVPLSAKTGEGTESLLTELAAFIPEGPQLYPDGMVSDQPEKRLLSEIIREKMLMELDREVPHGVAVEISSFETQADGLVRVSATIYCEKENHKGIIIGKKGAMLRHIGELARKDMEEMLGAKVFLETWVKVKENWRDNPNQLRNFGFEG